MGDVLYSREGPLSWVTIDRPERMNAFRDQTIKELRNGFERAWDDREVAVVALTGTGERAFSAGADLSELKGDAAQEASRSRSEVLRLHQLIRSIPKPVIAAVNGVAIGGGHVLHVVCDVTIAAEHARFGQAGPRVGSFDPGLGTAYLARVVGEKRAREIWFRCKQYDAATMERWGLVNSVVPFSELEDEVRLWANDMAANSPTALKFVKHSLNADSEAALGIGAIGLDALELFADTPEAREGGEAFAEKRRPDFAPYR